MKNKLSLFSIFLVILAFPISAAAQLEVTPAEIGFGDVEVGTSVSTVITITNVGIYLYEVTSASLSGNSDFVIGALSLPVTLTPLMDGPVNATLDIPVTFTPSIEGSQQCSLVVNGIAVASLSGVGVEVEPPPPPSILDILAFFDQSVASGTLVGSGPGNSANGRRGALRNMIEAVGDLLGAGEEAEACQQLLDAYQRCDGLPRPPEFVAGPAASTLAGMILDLMGELGCD